MSYFSRLLKEYAKKNPITNKVFLKLKNRKMKHLFKNEDIIRIKPVEDREEKPRLNIILTTLHSHAIYGGVSTAINLFNKISLSEEFEKRIIVQSAEHYSEQLTYRIDAFVHNQKENGIFFLGENNSLPVRKKDIFILTGWKTAYIFPDIVKWQIEHYKEAPKGVYLIQDYEPGFSPWSSEYGLAESTYMMNSNQIIAVFNSKELYDYFMLRGYNFYKSFYFIPSINSKLKEHLEGVLSLHKKRERLIIVYGRPSFSRNAFDVVRYAIKLWAASYSRAEEWKVISLGESFDDIDVGKTVIHCRGKVSIQEYAELMDKAFIGISLMVSPHPSYPPLEMSTFGVKTITNRFENKDLTGFNKNIISIDYISPELVSEKLIELCESFESTRSEISINEEYFYGKSFDNVIDELNNVISNELF